MLPPRAVRHREGTAGHRRREQGQAACHLRSLRVMPWEWTTDWRVRVPELQQTWLLDYWAELEATAEQTQRAIDNWISRETTTTKRNRY